MNKFKQKMYYYVDETGQDTAGRFFAVSILVTEADRIELIKRLQAIEEETSKYNIKWKKARPKIRKRYIEKIANLKDLHESIFFAVYEDSKEYLAHTADAVAKSITQKHADKAIVYIDALSDVAKQKIKKQLRPTVSIPTQVRSIRKEENSAFIRLVDAICGLVRDADEGKQWAKTMVQKLKQKNILKAL